MSKCNDNDGEYEDNINRMAFCVLQVVVDLEVESEGNQERAEMLRGREAWIADSVQRVPHCHCHSRQTSN